MLFFSLAFSRWSLVWLRYCAYRLFLSFQFPVSPS